MESIDKGKYPRFSPDEQKAWECLELMVRGAHNPEFTVEYFDRMNQQMLYIYKKSHKHPLIGAMAMACVEEAEKIARQKAAAG